MNELEVFLDDALVGELTDSGDSGLSFAYGESWLNRTDAVPISRQLPLRSEPHTGRSVNYFFKGVLPEEEPRQRIASILGISLGNDFGLLEQIGGECAGAVNIWPKGGRPAAGENKPPGWLNPEGAVRILRELPRRPLMAGEEGVRLSLAGAQSKLPVLAKIEDGEWRFALPMGNTPSSHIIKPEPERFPGLAANEYYCMSLAKAIGLNVPKVHYGVLDGLPYLLIERYDRVEREGQLVRLHQEDFCQALGITPVRKYQQEGGPSLTDCVKFLREWSSVPVLDVRDFVDGIIFTVLIGNADAHAKNFSMLYRDGERRLAPLYDQVCTLAWPELSRRLSMKLGPESELNAVTPDHFRIFSERAKLGWPMVRERLQMMCQSVLRKTEQENELKDTNDVESLKEVADLIHHRVDRLKKLINGVNS